MCVITLGHRVSRLGRRVAHTRARARAYLVTAHTHRTATRLGVAGKTAFNRTAVLRNLGPDTDRDRER